MVERRNARIEIWSEKDILALAEGQGTAASQLLSDVAAREAEHPPVGQVAHTGKYSKLAAWLAFQSTDQISATFDEIEEILGFPLPASCRKHPAHWHSHEGSAVARAIHDAGWKVSSLDLRAEEVNFRRRD